MAAGARPLPKATVQLQKSQPLAGGGQPPTAALQKAGAAAAAVTAVTENIEEEDAEDNIMPFAILVLILAIVVLGIELWTKFGGWSPYISHPAFLGVAVRYGMICAGLFVCPAGEYGARRRCGTYVVWLGSDRLGWGGLRMGFLSAGCRFAWQVDAGGGYIPAMSHESIVNLTEDNFAAEVENAEVPVLVDFWAEWCGPCKMIGPVLDELAAEKGDSVKITKVNVDENQGLAAKFGVRSIPMLLFFKGGEIKDQVVGVLPKDALAAKLDALA
jgi:thioredoxin 1